MTPKIIFWLLGLLAIMGGAWGWVMGRAVRWSARQCQLATRFWVWMAGSFVLFIAIPVLLLEPLSNDRNGLGLWMCIEYVVMLLLPLGWLARWWRRLPATWAETETSDDAQRRRLAEWCCVGIAIPAICLAVSLYQFGFKSYWTEQRIPASTVARIINETHGARFELLQRSNGGSTLRIMLPGRRRIRFLAPADPETLLLLQQHGIECRPVAAGRDWTFGQFDPAVRIMLVVCGFLFVPWGGVLLRELRRDARSVALELGKMDRALLALRADPAPRRAFRRGLAATTAVGFIIAVGLVEHFIPRVYLSETRLAIESADPKVIQQDLGALRSHDLMRAVALGNPGVALRFGRYMLRGGPVSHAEMANILGSGLIRVDTTNESTMVIGAYDFDSRGAAELANSVATLWTAGRDPSLPPVDVIARALPPIKPQYAWMHPALWGLGLLLAVLLGLAAGVCAACVWAWLVEANPTPSNALPNQPAAAGFTLVEMMVVIAIIGILASLLLPAMSHGKNQAQGVYCLNNGRQMTVAMTSYTDDYRDFFPPNPDDGNTIAGHNWCSGNAGIGGSEEFDPDVLADPKLSLLISYLGGNVKVFRCPGDLRVGLYQGSDPGLLGISVPAARTFSMSQAVGTICPGYDAAERNHAAHAHSGAPTLAVNGPWLNNQDDHLRDSPWITCGKFSAIRAPGPAGLWVLVDEDAKGLNDAAFAFGMEEAEWIDAPGTYHNGGCGFAFADGHSESHRWRSTAEKISHAVPANPGDYQDWIWMRLHTSANISGTMPPPL